MADSLAAALLQLSFLIDADDPAAVAKVADDVQRRGEALRASVLACETVPDTAKLDRLRHDYEAIIANIAHYRMDASRIEWQSLRIHEQVSKTMEYQNRLAALKDRVSELVNVADDIETDLRIRTQSREGNGKQSAMVGKKPIPIPASIADDAWMTHTDIADHHNVNREALRKRLDRYRASNHNGWKEVDQRGPNEPKYLFNYGSVKAIALDLQASGGTSGDRPAK